AYGHPARSRDDAKPLEILSRFNTLEMTSSFEDGGMRLQVSLDEKSSFEPPIPASAPRPDDGEIVSYHDLVGLPVGTVSIHQTEQPSSEGEGTETHRMETKVESVSQNGDRIIYEEAFRSLTGEEGMSGRQKTEMGPKGSKLLSWKGDSEFVADPDQDVYESPAELWPGLVFPHRTSQTWISDELTDQILSEGYVKVIGWDEIKGLEGAEVRAFRFERHVESLSSGMVNRIKTTEWLAPGYGLVKSVSESTWGSSSTQLISIKKPD
ncbi:MAG: hypothetical protein QNL33_20755, partial [Akkermansiaceae bacterium]